MDPDEPGARRVRPITLTIPGPSFITFNPDGSTTTVGTGPFGFARFSPETGEPGMFLVRGRFIVHADGEFEFVAGTIENVCSRLK